MAAWLLFEIAPAAVPQSVPDSIHWPIYLHSEDLATVAMCLALYLAVGFRRILLKAATAAAVFISTTFAVTNIGADYLELENPQFWALSVAAMSICVVFVIMRFTRHGLLKTISPGRLYLVVKEPRCAIDLLGLAWSGIGGSVRVYADGTTWRFSKKTEKLEVSKNGGFPDGLSKTTVLWYFGS